MMRLYLAHPFASRFTIRPWELVVENKFDIHLFNPFYDAPDRTDVEAIDAGKKHRYDVNPAELVENDLDILTNRCDGLVGVIDGSTSYGTIMEIAWAHNCEMPVFLIVTNGEEAHPWLVYHATQIFTSFTDFEKWLEERNAHA